MPKPGWSCNNRGWVLRGLVAISAIVLLGLLGGCSPRPPKPIVEQALTYRLSHPSSPVAALVGSDRLASQLEVQDVKVRQDRREPLLLASGEKLESHHLSGTYTLRVRLPGSRRFYLRKRDPFQLTLAHQKEQGQGPEAVPERWFLVSNSPDPEAGKLIDFLPQPAPPPELPPPEDSRPATAPADRFGL